MLDCDQALELLSAKIDGALTAEESAALEEHLAACPACRALLADFESLHTELPRLAAQPPAGLKDDIMAAVRQSKVTPFQGKQKQWRWRSLASLAAVLVLVFVGGSALRQWDGAASRAGQVPAAGGEPASNAAQDTTAPAVAAATPDAQLAGGTEEKAGRNLEDADEPSIQVYTEQQQVESTAPPATSAPTQEIAPAEGNSPDPGPPEERVNPTGLTITPDSMELTQAQALEKLALYLGWAVDGLTADSSGVLTGPNEDGVTRTITCTGLNEAGTGWVCQVEEIHPGTDGTASCATYTVPLDGSEITQP